MMNDKLIKDTLHGVILQKYAEKIEKMSPHRAK